MGPWGWYPVGSEFESQSGYGWLTPYGDSEAIFPIYNGKYVSYRHILQ